ncbi:MAG: HlyD family efflux transporter periplasmic adaptor subunit, partial [Candidatus Daviesbacteria bacterium]|nr:HlyD family efflux transporter periplasmic adaptor subunit [Candidatus Daviesbacteria bacterium]
ADLIAQVVDTLAIYFDTDIDEADISSVSQELSAEVTLDSYPGTILKGKVDQILPQTKTTSSGATVVTVRIKLDSSKVTFINGLSGQAAITIREVSNALVIPQEALREDNTVLVQNGQGIRPKNVVPGLRSDTDVEIKNGLNEGEKVWYW